MNKIIKNSERYCKLMNMLYSNWINMDDRDYHYWGCNNFNQYLEKWCKLNKVVFVDDYLETLNMKG